MRVCCAVGMLQDDMTACAKQQTCIAFLASPALQNNSSMLSPLSQHAGTGPACYATAAEHRCPAHLCWHLAHRCRHLLHHWLLEQVAAAQAGIGHHSHTWCSKQML